MTGNDPDIPTSGGVPVTDEQVQRLADEAEAGYDVDTLRRRGDLRPIGSATTDDDSSKRSPTS